MPRSWLLPARSRGSTGKSPVETSAQASTMALPVPLVTSEPPVHRPHAAAPSAGVCAPSESRRAASAARRRADPSDRSPPSSTARRLTCRSLRGRDRPRRQLHRSTLRGEQARAGPSRPRQAAPRPPGRPATTRARRASWARDPLCLLNLGLRTSPGTALDLRRRRPPAAVVVAAAAAPVVSRSCPEDRPSSSSSTCGGAT